MHILKRNDLITLRGEQIQIYAADDGFWACPVCGCLYEGEWAWGDSYACDSDDNQIGPISATASFNICPCCGTHYGYDDYPGPENNFSVAKAWEALRQKWLSQTPKTQEIVLQLQNIQILIKPE